MTQPADDEAPVAAWRAAYRASMQGPSSACPAGESLAALVCGDVAEDERRRVADHVVTCRACGDTYRLLIELDEEARGARQRAPWWRRSGALAATVLLATVALLVFWQARTSRTPVTPIDETVRGAAASVRPSHRAALSSPPDEFTWPAQAGATAYRLRLFDSAGDPIWEPAPVSDIRVPLGAEIGRSLQRGRAYFWVVDVDGPVARPRLGPFEFTLAAR